MFRTLVLASLVVALVGLAGCKGGQSAGRDSRGGSAWRETYTVDKTTLKATGSGRYFVLQPGAQWTYREGNETLVITVLNKTELVDGVVTRVIEEREDVGGKLKEVSRNFFALDPASGDVYYFGEDVDIYKDGRIAEHSGAWRSGVNGARFGLFIPGRPSVGQRFYQEIAPGVAMDRVEIAGVEDRVETKAGVFEKCIRFHESSALESGTGQKWFAPGVGLVKDGDMTLVSHVVP